LKLIKSTRVQRTFDRNVDEVAEQRALSARKQELTYRVDGLRAQVALAEKQRNELAIVSPIGGQVVTWDLDRLLSGRPVQRGETLMTVADTRGLWVVELEVPDDQIGHLLATGKRDTLVDVRFVLESDPGTVCHGTMREMALVAEQAGGNGASVMVTVDVDVESLPRRFPGATVDASIHCGTRSVGYVWFRQVIEWARRKLWI
ncbi:MAG: HlyD family secretion protein, partial [Planctomycetales bacterium]|nr:HlyD family secretion protein [Planctomycetales bacterium]